MPDFYGPDGGHREVFQTLVLIFSIISCLASILNIVLIVRMDKYSGHVLVLLYMTACQLIYDFSFYPGVINIQDSWIVVFANILQLIGGLGSSLYSNFISFVVMYVIKNRTILKIMINLRYFNVFCIAFISIEILLYILSISSSKFLYLGDIALLDIYYYFRLVSITFNLICCGLAFLQVRYMIGSKAIISLPEHAIYTLTTRMYIYPVVQLVSRSGLAWYEYVYKWDFDPDTVTKEQFALQCFCAIITPTAAIGYFIVFLIMQPQSYEEMLYLFRIKSKIDRPSDEIEGIKSAPVGTPFPPFNHNFRDKLASADNFDSSLEMTRSDLSDYEKTDGKSDAVNDQTYEIKSDNNAVIVDRIWLVSEETNRSLSASLISNSNYSTGTASTKKSNSNRSLEPPKNLNEGLRRSMANCTDDQLFEIIEDK